MVSRHGIAIRGRDLVSRPDIAMLIDVSTVFLDCCLLLIIYHGDMVDLLHNLKDLNKAIKFVTLVGEHFNNESSYGVQVWITN